MAKNIAHTILTLLNDPSVPMSEINALWNELINK